MRSDKNVMSESKALLRLKRKLTVENLWIYVAKTLTLYSPLRAYELKKKLQELFGLRPSTITVYTVVYRMTREGLLEAIHHEGGTVYRLSERGRTEFEKAMEFLRDTLRALEEGHHSMKGLSKPREEARGLERHQDAAPKKQMLNR